MMRYSTCEKPAVASCIDCGRQHASAEELGRCVRCREARRRLYSLAGGLTLFFGFLFVSVSTVVALGQGMSRVTEGFFAPTVFYAACFFTGGVALLWRGVKR
jgi:hypothetical protein